MCSPDIFLGLIAILFPPLAVWVKTGLCSADSLINICLCVLGYLPGLLHAWYIIAKFPENEYDYSSIPDQERGRVGGQNGGGRVTYVVVQGPNGTQRVPKSQVQKSGYGTTAPMAPPVHQGQDGTWANGAGGSTAGTSAGEGSSGGVPPSYAEAVHGDHKVQTRD